MTEILVDQKVFLKLFRKKKPKLFKHFKNMEIDFGLVCFPWLVCLLTSNLNKIIAETVFDFIFLEGSVTIFRAMFAILNILEPYILREDDFTEISSILDN